MRKLHCLPVSIRLLIRRVTCTFFSLRFPGPASLPAILPIFYAVYRSNDPFRQAMARQTFYWRLVMPVDSVGGSRAAVRFYRFPGKECVTQC